tara:strand:+ start:895 stop:1128 length:234 start_codon:yes stop_codon:yes gene_type:complete
MRISTFILVIALVFCVTIARAETTIVKFFVNGEAHTPVVSITETPHSVKVSIKNNETGEVIEGEVSTETTEEEPDCE